MAKINFSDFAKNPPKAEEKILDFWEKNKIFEKVLKKNEKHPPFRFFEGPPYANGRPGIHHILARVFKDIILRYKTMRCFYVPRKAGWDTQGLPTEMEVEKILGVKSKKEIEEKIGLEKFVENGKQNVFHYKEEWEKLTKRIAYWLDLENPYITMENSYLESLWWLFKKISKRGFLYKDFKIVPWCPRCETILSYHELAQGYKTVKDNSIFVKFPVQSPKNYSLKTKTYLLVWTTTPWTLISNAALAVNKKANYATIEKDGEWLILAEDRINLIERPFKTISRQKGESLVGLNYEPLYPDEEEKKNPANYKVWGADFVNLEEGTGIVHIAPNYGEDDLNLGKANNLSFIKKVSLDGKVNHAGYSWDGKYFKQADSLIIADLENRGLLWKKEFYEHEYPFCWRCGEPLIYYAKESWFLKTSALKKEFLRANQKIDWHPDFVGKGRFGEWLRENKDWAISRERYFGTPLPIWECGECEKNLIIGSLGELNEHQKEKTIFYLLRHGEATSNLPGGVGGPIKKENNEITPLTEKGKIDVEKITEKLKKEKIDFIFSSPMRRTRETAEIVSKNIGADFEIIQELHELDTGVYQGKPAEEFSRDYPFSRKLKEAPEGGENLREARARMIKTFCELNEKYKGKKILVVSHGDPLWAAYGAIQGFNENDYPRSWYPKLAELKKFAFPNWPFNRKGELDLHRPYIDKINLKCSECGGKTKRIKDVADVWFDSGGMPFAQHHYPFENKDLIDKKKHYPADYICEGIDQTRGWFYTMLAVSLLAGFQPAYKRVLVVGMVLDEKGEKMSKSRGNAVLPAKVIEKYGSEALRWYYYTVSNPWETKKFNEEDVGKALKRFIFIFWNSFVYYQTYRTDKTYRTNKTYRTDKTYKLKINEWLFAKLKELSVNLTDSLDKFDVGRVARELERFIIEDFSRWYIRRIRAVMKIGAPSDKKETSELLGFCLLTLAKFSSPFLPLFSELIYERSGANFPSVHLENWPKFKKLSKKEKALLKEMDKVRKIVSLALEERSRAGFKVRQPLSSAKIREKINTALLELFKDEVNVKKVVFDGKLKKDLELDLRITPELKREGIMRELVREIQEFRKKSGLKPKDKIRLLIDTDSKGKEIIDSFMKDFQKLTGIREIKFEKAVKPELELEIEGFKFTIAKFGQF